MTDIVEMLRERAARKWTDEANRSASLFGEAADEIERLRAERDELEREHMRIDREGALCAERDSFYMDYRIKCDAETKALTVERDALRADAERMRAALVECEHQTHSLRVWSGSQWSYHPPQAGRIASVARAAVDAAMASSPTAKAAD